MEERQDILVFTLDGKRYALLLASVERVVRAVEITGLPNSPAVICGAINVRGKIIPVINVRERFNLPEREVGPDFHFIIARTKRRDVVLVADSVVGIHAGSRRETESTGESLPSIKHIRGAAKIEGDIILIFDLETFLSLDEEAVLDAALSAGQQ